MSVGKKCTYFEDYILPGVEMISDKRKLSDFEEAINLYEKKYESGRVDERSVECRGVGRAFGVQQDPGAKVARKSRTASEATANRFVRRFDRRNT